MEPGCPELLEPPEDIFSTGSFLELGLNCPPSKVLMASGTGAARLGDKSGLWLSELVESKWE